MSKKILLITFFLSFLSPVSAQEKPNVIVILLDDMGIMDSSTYGSNYYETPNLTRLANSGVKFTKAYAASPLCSPTRSSILTGQFPARTRMTVPVGSGSVDNPQPKPVKSNMAVGDIEGGSHMPDDIITLAQVLKNNEYHTAHIGKWHLYHGNGGANNHQPEGHGFDYVIGGRTRPGPPTYYSPYKGKINNLTDGPEGENLSERLSQESIDWIEGLPADDKPFFLNLCQYAVHTPIISYAQADQKYKDSRDPNADQRCPEMATMLASMDSSVGILLDWLDLPENAALKSNTLIILTSDNGGVTHIYRRGDYNKGDPLTSNRPFRGGKANTYEGGMRVPWIMSWPGNSNITMGTESNVAVTTLDIFPTILDAADISQPNNQVLDGRSILPTLEGIAMEDTPIFTDFPHIMGILCAPSVAVRYGDWKLIRYYWAATSGGVPTHYYELFNLAKDPMEAINLTDYYPDKVTELDAMIALHLVDTDALIPLYNSEYSGAVPFRRTNNNSYLRPVTLTVENQQICVSENGQQELQLLDQDGVKRSTHALVLEGEDFVTVQNTADGKPVISWDANSSESTSKVLLGWSGGATTNDINDWTLAPVMVTIVKNREGCGDDSNLIPLGDFNHMASNESFNTVEADNNWRASSTGAVDWKGQSGGNPGIAAYISQNKPAYYLASNKITFEDGKEYSLSFDLKQAVDGANVDLYVGLSSTQDRANMRQNLFQTSVFSNIYANENVNFQVSGGGEYYIVFYTDNAAHSAVVNLYLDNVSLLLNESLGIASIENELIRVSPNPVADILYIKTRSKVSFRAIDLTGKIVLQGIADESIDVSTLKSGLYYLELTINEVVFQTQQFIKY